MKIQEFSKFFRFSSNFRVFQGFKVSEKYTRFSNGKCNVSGGVRLIRRVDSTYYKIA